MGKKLPREKLRLNGPNRKSKMFGDDTFSFPDFDNNTSPLVDRIHTDDLIIGFKSPSPMRNAGNSYTEPNECFEIPCFDQCFPSMVLPVDDIVFPVEKNKISANSISVTSLKRVPNEGQLHHISKNKVKNSPVVFKPFATFESMEVSVKSLNTITLKKVQRSLSTPTLFRSI